MKLAHMRSREGRRGGKMFQNGPLTYHFGRAFGESAPYNSTGRRDRRVKAGHGFHGHATTGRPGWAR